MDVVCVISFVIAVIRDCWGFSTISNCIPEHVPRISGAIGMTHNHQPSSQSAKKRISTANNASQSKKILIVSGSPKRNGNTACLVKWFCEGALEKNAVIDSIHVASLANNKGGCLSCRSCQKRAEYGCVIRDDVSLVLEKMSRADAIVMATPLYFFSASSQIKNVFDRMFSLYKWDNSAGAMKTALAGKTFALIASAYEDTGLDALEKPFKLTAKYTGMKFTSLLVPNAGVSGDIRKITGARAKAVNFGRRIGG